MPLKFSQHPGPHERHLRRRYSNPLFPASVQAVSNAQLEKARETDELELNHFLRYFRDLVQEAIDLKPEATSEAVLEIKSRLDKCYAHCCALPGEQSEIQAAIHKLIEVITKAVRQGAANDPVALDKLVEEEQARELHYQLMQFTLVADLMLPDSPISKDELAPSLLTESTTGLNAALQLFDQTQLAQIYQQAKTLLDQQPTTISKQSELVEKMQLIETTLNMIQVPRSD